MRFLITIFFFGLLLTIPRPAGASMAEANDFLQMHGQSSDWAAMALVSAGESVPFTVTSNTSGTATDLARRILALAAVGIDPAPVVETLLALQNADGSVADAQWLNDDMFFILALRAAGFLTSDPNIQAAATYLKLYQRGDGGWGTTTLSRSSVDMTAAAIQALVAVGETGPIARALTYLKSAQTDDGGFAFSPGGVTNIDSTAWAIHAIHAAGQSRAAWVKNGKTPVDALWAVQQANGQFGTSPAPAGAVLSTSYAVIALNGKSLPVLIYVPPELVVDDPTPDPEPQLDSEPKIPVNSSPYAQPAPAVEARPLFMPEPQVFGASDAILPETGGPDYLLHWLIGASLILIGLWFKRIITDVP